MAEEKQQEHSKEQPIIIKKKKGHGGHGHHGGAWKVAYADFVTAMMAFFIVMWILASSAEVKESISQYFNDPGAFNFITGERTIPIDLNLKPKAAGEGKGKGEGKGEGTNTFEISFNEEMTDSIVSRLHQKAVEDSIEAAKNIEKKSKELIKKLSNIVSEKPELEKMLESIKVELTDEGMRVELIESSDAVFFEVGSAKVKPFTRELLSDLAKEFGKLPNYIEIEGHTDSRGYKSSGGYTNWELSSDRANTARGILENNGLWPGQITKVTGYSDRKLRNPDNPFDVENRRVSILIKHLSSKDLIPNEKGG